MARRSLIVLLVAAALAAATFFIVWSRDRDGAVAPAKEPAGIPAANEPPERAGAGSAASGRSESVQRVVSTRLGHPPGLKLVGVRSGQYMKKIGVVCGTATWRGQADPMPFVLAGRRLTTGDDALAIAVRVEGCADLREHSAIAGP